MLKATECRLGNIVSFEGKEYKLECIHANHPSLENYGFVTWDKLQGVPITEEWLLSVGFEKHHSNPYWYNKKQLCISVLRVVELISWDRKSIRIERKIHFIHQLQNLYHSLTGEELC